MSLAFSPDQLDALARIRAGVAAGVQTMTLAGPAGSGKSTIMRKAAADARELGRKVVFAAPTGKAALRLRQTTGDETTTLHSLLYDTVIEGQDGDPLFFGQRRQLTPDSLLVVDEASMVGVGLHEDILAQLPAGAVLLYVGDHEQLPPVREPWGPSFDNPTALLSEIHRQAAGNPIVSISAAVRHGEGLPAGSQGDAYARTQGTLDAVARWVCHHLEAGGDVVALAWRHVVRRRVNELVRQRLGFAAGGPLVVGDRLKVCFNNRHLGRMNGEIVTVQDVREVVEDDDTTYAEVVLRGCEGRETTAFVNPALVGADIAAYRDFVDAWAEVTEVEGGRNRWLHVDHGYCLTVHSSQGSEFESVVFVMDEKTERLRGSDPEFARRLIYTAVTRAKQRLRVVDVRAA